jgi:hypothetical protein
VAKAMNVLEVPPPRFERTTLPIFKVVEALKAWLTRRR